MSFAQGLNVGSNMALGAYRLALASKENQRTQEVHDRKIQAEDDAARIMAEAQGQLAQQTAPSRPAIFYRR